MIALARPLKRRWTGAEDEVLLRSRRVPLAQVAADLGRSASAVGHRRFELGLTDSGRGLAADGQAVTAVRRLHREGLSDREIASEVGVDQAIITRLRHRLGLEANRSRQREGNYMARAARAALLGWPVDLPSLAVRLLDVLHNDGPKTRRGLSAAVGLRTCDFDYEYRGEQGNALSLVMARGLAVKARRDPDPRGDGSRVIYRLAPGVRPGKALALSAVAGGTVGGGARC
jgi:hypothetical protein